MFTKQKVDFWNKSNTSGRQPNKTNESIGFSRVHNPIGLTNEVNTHKKLLYESGV